MVVNEKCRFFLNVFPDVVVLSINVIINKKKMVNMNNRLILMLYYLYKKLCSNFESQYRRTEESCALSITNNTVM